jgi:CRISPR-associated protein Cmr5
MVSIAADIAQRRASWAWDRIAEQEACGPKVLKEYRNFVKGVPAMINSNGLIATMAYLQSRSGGNAASAETVFEHLRAWLVSQSYIKARDKHAVFEGLLEADTKQQRVLIEESIAILAWLRRFADVVHEGVDNAPQTA